MPGGWVWAFQRGLSSGTHPNAKVGRSSRALAYFVLCAKIGYRLPGHVTLRDLYQRRRC